MSYLDFYPYQHSYPYPYLYPYQYHLRHRENAGWERGFGDELAEKNEGMQEKVLQRFCGPLWRVTSPSFILRGTTAWTPSTTPIQSCMTGSGARHHRTGQGGILSRNQIEHK